MGKRPGRPAKSKDEKLGIGIRVPLTDPDKAKIESLARSQERDVAQWCRLALLDALRRKWKP